MKPKLINVYYLNLNYLILVDTEPTTINNQLDHVVCHAADNKTDWLYKPNVFHKDLVEAGYWKVTGHLPLNGAPLLEGVPLLVPLPEQGVTTEMIACANAMGIYDSRDVMNQASMGGYIRGYVDASTKDRKYTEEDMRSMFQEGRRFEQSGSMEDSFDAVEDVLESFSAPVGVPVDFIPEYEERWQVDVNNTINPDTQEWVDCTRKEAFDFDRDGGLTRCLNGAIKTILNEQGVPVIQGKWVFKS